MVHESTSVILASATSAVGSVSVAVKSVAQEISFILLTATVYVPSSNGAVVVTGETKEVTKVPPFIAYSKPVTASKLLTSKRIVPSEPPLQLGFIVPNKFAPNSWLSSTITVISVDFSHISIS